MLAAAVALAGCSRVAERLREEVLPSAHERYAARLRTAGLDSTALGGEWLRAAERALADARPVTLPARETGYFAPGEAAAVGYRAPVRRGQRLTVQLEPGGGAPYLLFVDIFRPAVDSGRGPERLASADSATTVLDVVAEADGELLVRLQPELLRGGRYTVTMRVGASLAFPVSGRNARAVRSFWGADRDGGRRRHEGVDIFAPRGTPAVAATEGTVAGVRTTSIGGNVVWLRDARTRQSLYYAHLDTQLVTTGQRVRPGDTLGLVGNTGNARTTPPHLHFGVYRPGGAVDPFPFVDEPQATPAPVTAPLAALGEWRRTTRATTLRPGPGAPASPAIALARHTLVRVDAAAGGSYRVRLADGLIAGYLPATQLEPATAAVARVSPPAGAAVLARPLAGAAEVDTLPPGESRATVGRFGGYAAVRTRTGTIGWVAE